MIAGTTILVVDDEETDRTAMADALREQFATVFEADSYGSAMAMFDLHRDAVEFLISDVSLPDGNGCALAVAMQKQQPALRVLFASGHVGSEVCKYYGLDVDDLHFLRKPFDKTELASRVEAILISDKGFPKLYVPKKLANSGDLG
jgi:DNA-binding response OmpR family regulator